MAGVSSAALTAVCAVLVFGLSAWGCGRYRRWATVHQLLDVPGARSSHKQPIPRGAGLVLALLVLVFGGALLAAGAWHQGPPKIGFVTGAALVAAVSWTDDVHSLPRAPRLLVHLLAATILILSCGDIERFSLWLPAFGVVTVGSFAWPLLLLWVVGLTNAYNFMDGIDGLAGLQAVVAGLGWFLLAGRFGLDGFAGVGLLLAAASSGFLIWNLPRARLFLGDTGSAFLGYCFAALGVSVAFAEPGSPLLPASALLLWPLLFDSGLTLLTRWRRGHDVLQPHREHIYQRLVDGGWSHPSVALLYAGLSLVGAVCSWLLQFRRPLFEATALASIAVLALWLWSLARGVAGRQPGSEERA